MNQRGYLLLLFLHMVAAGKLCCLSDNSGYIIPITFDLVTLTSNFESHTLNVAIHIWLPLGELRCLLTTLVVPYFLPIIFSSKRVNCIEFCSENVLLSQQSFLQVQ